MAQVQSYSLSCLQIPLELGGVTLFL